MNDDVPAKQAMLFYFYKKAIVKAFSGRKTTTLPVMIDNDLKAIHAATKTKKGRKKNTIRALPSTFECITDLRALENLARP